MQPTRTASADAHQYRTTLIRAKMTPTERGAEDRMQVTQIVDEDTDEVPLDLAGHLIHPAGLIEPSRLDTPDDEVPVGLTHPCADLGPIYFWWEL